MNDEIDVFIMEQNQDIKEKLQAIKKHRTVQYPYKKPFSSLEHISSFVAAIEQGQL